jgi:N6-L-threonylcarbamoyladenine synthase
MLILGIESSCDETGVALVGWDEQGRAVIRGEILASQVELHEKYGGVVPELASREHMKSLPLLCDELFTQSGCSISDVDAIGVTCGPGLKGCLLTGVTFAQGIAASVDVPLVPVNHIEGHILSAELHEQALTPPYVALVVSGGHTELVLVEALGKYTVLCRTRDDAAGEAFDKSANLLGFGYPGGARLAALADTVDSSRYKLPRVAREIPDFTFSGLKTAVLLTVERNRRELEQDPSALAEMAWSIQDAILDPLVHKTVREVSSRRVPLVVCGGVSANKALRKRLTERLSRVYFPPMKHSVDNGAMIAYAAGRHIRADGPQSAPLVIRGRWPIEELAKGDVA